MLDMLCSWPSCLPSAAGERSGPSRWWCRTAQVPSCPRCTWRRLFRERDKEWVKRMNEWMNEWMNKRMNEWTTNERTNEQKRESQQRKKRTKQTKQITTTKQTNKQTRKQCDTSACMDTMRSGKPWSSPRRTFGPSRTGQADGQVTPPLDQLIIWRDALWLVWSNSNVSRVSSTAPTCNLARRGLVEFHQPRPRVTWLHVD